VKGIEPSCPAWEVGLLHLYCPTSYVPLPELTVDIYGHQYLRPVRAGMQVRATRSPSATARDSTLPRVRTSGFLAPGCEWTPDAHRDAGLRGSPGVSAAGAWRCRRNTSFEQHASTIGKRREWAESHELQVVKDGDLLRA
jgi:hypothetical protein